MDNYLIDQLAELTRPASLLYGRRDLPVSFGDSAAHTWRVTVTRNGEAADLSGYSAVAGYFLRSDGVTVVAEGSKADNVAEVTLPAACYAAEGHMKGLLRAEGATEIVTLAAATFDVRVSSSGETVDPGESFAARYAHVKYSDLEPASNADMKDEPSDWMGFYNGTSHVPPADYTAYDWFLIRGYMGLQGPAGASIVGASLDGGDILFTKDDASAVRLEGAVAALTGPQGEPFEYGDFTEEQLAALVGPGGSPSGVYVTMAALTTADPSHDYVYLVTADGHWYYWSGSAWADGGDYMANLSLDETLTVQGYAADSHAVGRAMTMREDGQNLSLVWEIGAYNYVTGADVASARAIRCEAFTVARKSVINVLNNSGVAVGVYLIKNNVNCTYTAALKNWEYYLEAGDSYKIYTEFPAGTVFTHVNQALDVLDIRIDTEYPKSHLRMATICQISAIPTTQTGAINNTGILGAGSHIYGVVEIPDGVKYITFTGDRNPVCILFYTSDTLDNTTFLRASYENNAAWHIRWGAPNYCLHEVPPGATHFVVTAYLSNYAWYSSSFMHYVYNATIGKVFEGTYSRISGEVMEDGSIVASSKYYLSCDLPECVEAVILSINVYVPVYINCYDADGVFLGRSNGEAYMASPFNGGWPLHKTHKLPFGTRNFKSEITNVTTGSVIATYNDDNTTCYIPFGSKRLHAISGSTQSVSTLADSTARFTVPVNCYKQDVINEASALQDGMAADFDYGVILFPSTYTDEGTPTRLIVCCHGAGGTVDAVQSQIEGLTQVKYFVANGYAVMDVNGLPAAYAAAQGIDIKNNVGSWLAVQCYVAGFHYVMERYNLKRDGVLVYGASMGGISSANLVMSGSVPVIAHAIHCPVLDTYNQVFLHPWSGGLPKTALSKLFDFELDGENYVYDEAKVRGYNPTTNHTVSVSGTDYKMYPCPVKIWHARNDATVSYAVSAAFITAIKNYGGTAHMRSLATGGHDVFDAGSALESPSGETSYRGATLAIKPVMEETYLWLQRYK